MSLFHRSGSSASAGPRRPRRVGPSCRGGASSMLRLAQPASPRQGGLSYWLTRAASVLAPCTAQAVAVRRSELAPSRWVMGH